MLQKSLKANRLPKIEDNQDKISEMNAIPRFGCSLKKMLNNMSQRQSSNKQKINFNFQK